MDPIYEVLDADQLITPCLLVYPELIRENLLATIQTAGGCEKLRMHVKTHKCPDIVKRQLELGLSKHKCATLREAEMLAECGVPDVLIAYPQVGPAALKLRELVTRFPNTRFATTVDNPRSLAQLDQTFTKQPRPLDVFVDIDNGMHRTGILAGDSAIVLIETLVRSRSLHFAGLHIYDGQNHQPDLAERQAAVLELMRPIRRMIQQLAEAGHAVPKLVCGGTPTFPIYANLDVSDLHTQVECSPGTCVLSDYNYGKDYPDLKGIRHAAVLMTRVISKPAGGQAITVDLGNKAVASDPPAGQRVHFLNLNGAREGKHNEEHLMIECPAAERLEVGDVLYALPAHICPTVNLYQRVHCVEGNRLAGSWQIAARDRLTSLS